MSKSAKKNAARKAKKATQPDASSTQQGSSSTQSAAQAQAMAAVQQSPANTVDIATADALAAQLGDASVSTEGADQAGSDDPDAKRKRLRNLRKKVRQIQEQVEKAAASDQGQSPELDAKIANLPALCAPSLQACSLPCCWLPPLVLQCTSCHHAFAAQTLRWNRARMYFGIALPLGGCIMEAGARPWPGALQSNCMQAICVHQPTEQWC